jgi:hypothetical protein
MPCEEETHVAHQWDEMIPIQHAVIIIAGECSSLGVGFEFEKCHLRESLFSFFYLFFFFFFFFELNITKKNFLFCNGVGIAMAISVAASARLIYLHLRNYTNPTEQTHICRILLMVPIYAVDRFIFLI